MDKLFKLFTEESVSTFPKRLVFDREGERHTGNEADPSVRGTTGEDIQSWIRGEKQSQSLPKEINARPAFYSSKKKQVEWKYASPKKALMFQLKFPELKATDKEIETAAWKVFNEDSDSFGGDLDKAWKSPLFHKLIKLQILEQREAEKKPKKIEKKVVWKYANQERAATFKKQYPTLGVSDQEIEDAAYFVFAVDVETREKYSNLDDAWKNPHFLEDMRKYIVGQKGR